MPAFVRSNTVSRLRYLVSRFRFASLTSVDVHLFLIGDSKPACVALQAFKLWTVESYQELKDPV